MADRRLDDFRAGDTYVSQIGRTVLGADNFWFTGITHNTNHAETEVLSVRASASRPGQGIVEVRTRGINQRGETVIEFERSFLIARA